MARQAARFLSRRPLRSSRPVVGKQTEAEQGPTQQTYSGRTAPWGQTSRRIHGLFPKEPRKQMPNGYAQGTRRPTGPPDRSADHARRPGRKSSRPKSQHHNARRMVPARLPRQQSKARARLPKAKTKTKPRRTRQSKRKPSPCNRCSTTCPTTARFVRTSRPSCKVCKGSSKTKEAKGPGCIKTHGAPEELLTGLPPNVSFQ